jgi:signal transduction histidine kinase
MDSDSAASFLLSSAILDSLVEQVAIIDRRGRIVHANTAWKNFARLRSGADSAIEGADYLGLLRRAVGSGSDAAQILAGIESVLTGSTSFFEYEYPLPSENDIRWFYQRVSSLRDSSGAVISHFDITDRKRAQQEREAHRFQLGRAVRAATLGQLSGALAHELNQPIAAILTNAQVGVAMRARRGGTELFGIFEDIERDARRAGAIIRRLRNMLERHDKKLELISFNEIIEETLRLCKNELIARRIDLAVRLEPDLPPLHGDRIALQHMLLNVIVNAYEAMSQTGTANRILEIATATTRNASIRVTVLDSGPGLADATGSTLFEPLYTTKEGGLGLGLSICRSIIDAHDGQIAISNALTGGTLVRIELPAARSADAERAEETPS